MRTTEATRSPMPRIRCLPTIGLRHAHPAQSTTDGLRITLHVGLPSGARQRVQLMTVSGMPP